MIAVTVLLHQRSNWIFDNISKTRRLLYRIDGSAAVLYHDPRRVPLRTRERLHYIIIIKIMVEFWNTK